VVSALDEASLPEIQEKTLVVAQGAAKWPMLSRAWEEQLVLVSDERLVWEAETFLPLLVCPCDAAMVGNHQLVAVQVGQLVAMALAGYMVDLDSMGKVDHSVLDKGSYI
jgi:hypothetical protein